MADNPYSDSWYLIQVPVPFLFIWKFKTPRPDKAMRPEHCTLPKRGNFAIKGIVRIFKLAQKSRSTISSWRSDAFWLASLSLGQVYLFYTCIYLM